MVSAWLGLPWVVWWDGGGEGERKFCETRAGQLGMEKNRCMGIKVVKQYYITAFMVSVWLGLRG